MAAAAALLFSACATARPADPHAGHGDHTAAPADHTAPGAPGPPGVHGAHGTHAGHDPDDGRQRVGYTLADVHFMQHMIAHHAQALVMSEMVPERTSRRELHLLAERIEVSQQDEIALMRNWLRDRQEEVPPADAHVHMAMGHGDLMPGMLTQRELDSLRAARGNAFDRLFLELMIKHHEGAIIMVEELFESPGAGQNPEIFIFATDVQADQTAEIQRMRRLLGMLPAGQD